MKTLRITTHWTTEQAEDMFTLLDDLKSAIWQSYGEDIVTTHHEIVLEQKKESDEVSLRMNRPFNHSHSRSTVKLTCFFGNLICGK